MLNNLKLMLGIEAKETDQDEKLKLIIANVTARLKLLLGGIEPTEEMDHIILEVSVIRFNRIGSEGMTGHTIEGESVNYCDDDFASYVNEIQAFLASQKESVRGRVRFL